MAMRVKGRMSGSGRAASAPTAGTQGTLGGVAQQAGSAPGKRNVVLGLEVYLWALVFIEVGITAWLRASFSRYHGG